MSAPKRYASAVMLVLAMAWGSDPIAQAPSPRSTVPTEAVESDGLAVLAERLRTNERRLSHVRQAYERLTVAAAPLDRPAEAERAPADRPAARLAALQAVLAASGRGAGASVADLERRVTEATRQRDALAERQAALLASRNAESNAKGLAEDAPLRGLAGVQFTLVKNRVVPLEVPFYSVQRTQLRDSRTGQTVDGAVITRVQDGELADDALRPNGVLDSRLKNADPTKQYVMLAVCADSVAAFRLVSAELSRRGFAWAWDTARDERILLRMSAIGSGNGAAPEGILPKRK